MNSVSYPRISANRVFPIFSVLLFLLIWQIFATIYSVRYLPSPINVIRAFITLTYIGDIQGHTLLEHSLYSLWRVLLGVCLATIIGIPLGLAAGWSRRFNWFVMPILDSIRPIPPLAWIPFAIAVFGLGLKSHVFIIFLGAFFPILTNTTSSVRATEKTYVDVAVLFGATSMQMLRKVVFPRSIPDILTGLRIGIGIGWMCLVASEMIGLLRPVGLGYLIQSMVTFGRMGDAFAGMITIGLIGYLMNAIILKTEKYLLVWREERTE
ncbi:MAG: ABC transporter permease [Candidatus Heimdallarchaeota archaeon]